MKKIRNVFVLSTAVLSFISFWRASAIVLSDFGSSAYYAGGIAAKTYGQSFPYFIIIVMLLSGLLLMTYIESSSLFTRGGVYVVVKETMGRTMAKIGVSALVFDYLLTGPVSSISAGLYLAYLVEVILPYFKIEWNINPRLIAVVFSILVILYYWMENIRGLKESSESNVKITIFVALVAIILFILSLYTISKKGFIWPKYDFSFSKESCGWLYDLNIRPIGILGVLIALGHSILALSGLETLAQVYREIEDPKVKNLKKAVIVIFVFSFIFTGLLTFFSAVIIPYDKIASQYSENLLSGLAMEMAIGYKAKILLKILVVISALLMLVGAVNTAIIGSNGILNRVAEDGVLPDYIRKLHPKYGTTYIIISIVAFFQIIIVMFSKGDVFLLGEGYAFGVIMSLTINVLSLIFLRFKRYDLEREYMFPLNIKWDKYYVPIGLIILFLIMLSLFLTNLFTKKIATIAGIAFTIFLYSVFTYFEKKSNKIIDLHKLDDEIDEEKVNIYAEDNVLSVFKKFTKQNKILIPIRNPNNLSHLKHALENYNDENTDIIVLYVKVEKGYEYALNYENLTSDEKYLFKSVILLAEKYGKTVHPVIVFSNDPFYTIVYISVYANINSIIMGVSGKMGAEEQLEQIAINFGLVKPTGFNRKIDVSIVWEARTLSYTLK